MLQQLLTRGSLAGKKTYIVAAFTIIASWAGFAVGEPVLGQDALSIRDALEITVTCLLAATFRSGMNTSAANAANAAVTTLAAPPEPANKQINVEDLKRSITLLLNDIDKKSVPSSAASKPIVPAVTGTVANS